MVVCFKCRREFFQGLSNEGSLTCQLLPHHRTSVFTVISERPVVLISKCRALGEEANTTHVYVLGLSEVWTHGFQLISERSTNELLMHFIECNSIRELLVLMWIDLRTHLTQCHMVLFNPTITISNPKVKITNTDARWR